MVSSTKEAIKRGKIGKPRIFESEAEMQIAIDDYFKHNMGLQPIRDARDNIVKDKNNNPIYDERVPTTIGLALHLGFASRDSMLEYYNYSDEYSRILCIANAKIDNFAETQILKGVRPQGLMFWLKNFSNDKGSIEDASTVNNNHNYAFNATMISEARARASLNYDNVDKISSINLIEGSCEAVPDGEED